MASHVDIANIALNKIGAKPITSALSESTQINTVYYTVLDEVLMEHPWTFAQKREALTSTTAPTVFTEDGLTTCFLKPTTMLKLNFVNSDSAIVKIESTGILCNESALSALFTYRCTDASIFPAPFITAFATRLAAEVCFNYTESTTKQQALIEEYEKIRLPHAIASDSQQGSSDEIQQDDWENARTTSGSWASARRGAETWHPVS